MAARRAGVWYRWSKWLEKHRRLVAAAAVALAVSAAALGWGIKTRSEVAERERLARQFTELVEHIEATARYSALSPPHDIRADQRGIRAQMEELEREIARGGAIAVGPGNYALGRGARFEARQRQARAEDFEAAAQAFQKAIDADPDDQENRLAFGHFCAAWAVWLKETGRDPGAALKRGFDLAGELLGARPAWAEARIVRASLLLAQASAATRPAERRDGAERALSDFKSALSANPNLERVWRSQVAAAERLAAGVQ